MRECRVAVIGLGKMGLLHASILSAIPGVQLVSLCDQKKTIVRIAKEFLNQETKVVTDLTLLSNEDLDAIFVTTPITTHFKVIETIYTKKISKNVFTEKTLAKKYDEAEKICEIAEHYGGVNTVGYQKRYCVTYKKALELLNQEIIGIPNRFRAYSYSSDFVGFSQKDLTRISDSRGGLIRDLGAHALSLAFWFFGDIITDSEPDIDNAARFSVKVQSLRGVEGQIETSWCEKGYRIPETGIVIEGTKGILSATEDKIQVKSQQGEIKSYYRQDLNDNVSFLLWAPEYYREDASFIQSAMSNEQLELDFSEGSKIDKLIEQVT